MRLQGKSEIDRRAFLKGLLTAAAAVGGAPEIVAEAFDEGHGARVMAILREQTYHYRNGALELVADVLREVPLAELDGRKPLAIVFDEWSSISREDWEHISALHGERRDLWEKAVFGACKSCWRS